MNKYYLQARLFPAVLTAIPLFVLVNGIILKYYSVDLRSIISILPYLLSFSITAAATYFFIQINRILSKSIFQSRFFDKDELNMPTTVYLLWSNEFFENSIKNLIHTKVKKRYAISLMSPDQEAEDEINAKKLVTSAVSQIRISLKNNSMLLQHNIEYGFIRNLLGGCIQAVLFSLAIILYSEIAGVKELLTSGLVLGLVYLIPILLSKFLINIYGRNYAKILFEQFLSVKK